MDRAMRRRELDLLAELNRFGYARDADPETLTRIEQFELSFRMQASVPDLCDLSKEDSATRALYGAKVGRDLSPTTAYSPDVSSKPASASFSCTTGVGTTMARTQATT